MPSTVQPVIVTPNPDRLLAFYCGLLGAVETRRVPEEGAPFYIGLSLGTSELGVVSDASAEVGEPQRILLSIEVDDVDAHLERVVAAGGAVLGPANDMPWGQRVGHVHDPDGNLVNLTHTG